MPGRSKPTFYTVQYIQNDTPKEQHFTNEQKAKDFFADLKRDASALVPRLRQSTLTGLVAQKDDTAINLQSSPESGSEAANILDTFDIPNYAALVIPNPSRNKDFKSEYDRGYRYTTLDEGIERYGSSARHLIPFTHFYQDRAGWWHAYVEIDSP